MSWHHLISACSLSHGPDITALPLLVEYCSLANESVNVVSGWARGSWKTHLHLFFFPGSLPFPECLHCSYHWDICWDQSAVSADVGVEKQHHLHSYNTGIKTAHTHTHKTNLRISHTYIPTLKAIASSVFDCSMSWRRAFLKSWMSEHKEWEHGFINVFQN